jgi:hypothetical protein
LISLIKIEEKKVLMSGFYINLTGFQKHEVGNAAGKSFRFTELICETENPYGFFLELCIEYKGIKPESMRTYTQTISTCPHPIYSNRRNYFGFESHKAIALAASNRLFVQIISAGYIPECKSKLLCELG